MRKHDPTPDRNQADIDQLRRLGYETEDVSLPTLMRWGIGLLVFVGATSIVTWLIYLVFVPGIGTTVTPPQAVESKIPAGEPVIQVHPRMDMSLFRRIEADKVSKYGWVDKETGLAREPVDVTLDRIAESGQLPKAAAGGGAIERRPSADRVNRPEIGGHGGLQSMPPGFIKGTVPGIEADAPKDSNRPRAPESNEPGHSTDPNSNIPNSAVAPGAAPAPH
jgi:hypothetical protein